MTVMELLNECIVSLGEIRPSVDELEIIALPIRQVKDKLIAIKNCFEDQEKKKHEDEQKEVEQKYADA